MKLFTSLYEKVIAWSKHPKASYYLGALSFAESSFFPIPPDVMLAPMSLARPNRAWWFALITTVASVLGGILGYLIGVFAFEFIEPWLQSSSYFPKFELAKSWFADWGVWGRIRGRFFANSLQAIYSNRGVFCLCHWFLLLSHLLLAEGLGSSLLQEF